MARLRGKASQILLGGRRFHRSRSSSSSSSSRQQPEGFEKFICFWASAQKGKTEWYVCNVSSNDFKYKKMNEKKRKRGQRILHHHDGDKEFGMRMLRPFSVTTRNTPECRVALGSIIYRLGGLDGRGKELRKVFCFDITRPDDGWKKGTPMINGRCNPNAEVLDGKLYVMGGIYSDGSGPWAEVFDPCLKKWEPLPPPSSQPVGHHFISAVLDDSKSILVVFPKSNVLYMFDEITKSWIESDDHDIMIHAPICDGRPAVVGHTLYWFARSGELYAYDLDLKRWFFGSIKGLEEDFEMQNMMLFSFAPCLLHLGGKELCLVWSDQDDDSNNMDDDGLFQVNLDRVRFHCVKLRVSKSNYSEGRLGCLNAFIKSCQSYDIDHDVCFMDSLLLDGMVGAVNKQEEGRFHRSSSSSSSRHGPEGSEKYICFWACAQEGKTEWYVCNVSSNDFKYKKMSEKRRKRGQRILHHHDGDKEFGMRMLRPFSVTTRNTPECRVALGSIIYRLGGLDGRGKELRKVFCFDITRPDDGWKKGTPMINGRCNPNAEVLDGKLYVMGGIYSDGSGPWAEVFDPCLKKWEPLPPPSSQLVGHYFISAVLDDSKSILVVFPKSNVLYMFDVMTKSWIESDDHDIMNHPPICDGRPAVVGHTLYWFTRSGKLYAYDLDLKRWFVGSINGLEEDFEMQDMILFSFIPCLLHLGGKELCLVWSDQDDDSNNMDDDGLFQVNLDRVRFHCVKLRVSKSNYSEGRLGCLNAFIKSCQSYDIDHDVCFMDSLLLDGMVGAVNKQEEGSASREVAANH